MDENELRWVGAFKAWRANNSRLVAELLLDENFVIPADMRYFLADLVLGTVERDAGRPSDYSTQEMLDVAHAYFREYQRVRSMTTAMRKRAYPSTKFPGATPAEIARKVVAIERKSSPGAIKGVVDRLRKMGFTFEDWKARTKG